MTLATDATGLLIAIAVKATVLLTLAAVVEGAILRRRASAAARHLLWTLTLSGLLLLPALAWIVPDWRVSLLPANAPAVLQVERPAHPVSSDTRPADAGGAPENASNVLVSGEALSPSVTVDPPQGSRGSEGARGLAVASWAQLLLGLYVAGVLLLLLKVVGEQLIVRQLARNAFPVDSDWRAMADSVAASLGVRRPVALFRIDAPTMPLTWGIIRPAVLLPTVAAEWPESRRRAVLLHELAHVSRYDCLTQTLAAIACALYWPHPGAWWAAGRLRLERELACDDIAMESGVRPREYAGHLLELARSLTTPRALTSLAVGMAGSSHLETRLTAALERQRPRAQPSRRARVLGAVLTALLLVPLAAVGGGAAESSHGPTVEQRSDEVEMWQTRGGSGEAKGPQNSVESTGAAVDTATVADGTWVLRLEKPAESQTDVPTVHVALWAPSAADLTRMQNRSLSADTVQRINEHAARRVSVEELLNPRVRVNTPVDLSESTAATPVRSTTSTPLAGRWILSGTPGAGARLELRWDDDTQWRRSIELTDLSGVSADAINSDAAVPVSFRVEQDAGTFEFKGSFQAGSGAGQFRFHPNHRFIPVLRSLGIGGVGEVTDHKLKNLAFGAISAAAIREFQSLGFASLTLEDLLDLAVRQVTPAYARQMQSLGVSGTNTVPGLIELRFRAIPVAYVGELAALGYRGISASTVAELWKARVTPAFIQSVLDAGRDASPDRLIAMKDRERAERRVR